MSELLKEIENGRLLKNNGSWMYCDKCNKTVGYLVYSTYQKFKFEFDCKCGNKGSFKLGYKTDSVSKKSTKDLKINKNRLCCPNDDSPLFTIAEKNIDKVKYSVVCKKCETKYENGNKLTIREIRKEDVAFLQEALYEAIYIPKGAKKLPRDIIELPELNRYISEFGRKDDFCLLAEQNGKLVGAIWTRIFYEKKKGYGFVDEKTPELSMSVSEKYRNKSIGKLLLESMIVEMKKKQYEQISLSVDKANYAYEFYKKHGFENYSETETSVTMIKKMNENAW